MHLNTMRKSLQPRRMPFTRGFLCRGVTQRLGACSVGLIAFYTLWALLGGTWGVSHAAVPSFGPCELGYVRHGPGHLPIVRVALRSPVATTDRGVALAWLGHSSFLMTSPSGLRVLIDPSALYPPSAQPDVITVSNLHGTHSAVDWIPGSPRVLWGLRPDTGWNRMALTIQDVSLFNIPSYADPNQLEESPVQNSIFVFRTGGLCIVHLGNLRHPLTSRQLQQLGTPDVVMIPVDDLWTLSHTDVFRVVGQLRPRLVIPMHIDYIPDAEDFVRFSAGRYPLRHVIGNTLSLRRSSLPVTTEIVVFGGREG